MLLALFLAGVRFDVFAPSLLPPGVSSGGTRSRHGSSDGEGGAVAGRAPMEPTAAGPVASFSLSGARRGHGATFRIARVPSGHAQQQQQQQHQQQQHQTQ